MHGRAACTALDMAGARGTDLMLWLEKEFGKGITTRTWKTVNRLLEKMNG